AAPPDLPHLGGAEEDVVGVEDGQDEPPPAVEEAGAQDVHRDEAPGRPEQEVGQAAAATGGGQLEGRQLRVAIGPGDEVLDAAVSLVDEGVVEPADGFGDASRLGVGSGLKGPSTPAGEHEMVIVTR